MARTENGSDEQKSSWLGGSEMKVHKGLGFMTLAESPMKKGFDGLMERMSASVGLASRVMAFTGIGAVGGTALALQDTPVPDITTTTPDAGALKLGDAEQYVASNTTDTEVAPEQHVEMQTEHQAAAAEPQISDININTNPEAAPEQYVEMQAEPQAAAAGPQISDISFDTNPDRLADLSPAAGPQDGINVQIEPLHHEMQAAPGIAEHGDVIRVDMEPLNSEMDVAQAPETPPQVISSVEPHITEPVIAEAPPPSGIGANDIVMAASGTIVLTGGTQLATNSQQSEKVAEAACAAKDDLLALYGKLCESVGISTRSAEDRFQTAEVDSGFKDPKQIRVAQAEQRGVAL